MIQLRDRFGHWCKRMAERNPDCVAGLACIEAWSSSADQMLEDAGRYLSELPDGLGLGRFTGTVEYGDLPSAEYLYAIERFSTAQKRSLLRRYEFWAEPGRSSSKSRPDLFRRMHAYGLSYGSVARVVVFCDGREVFRSSRVWATGGTRRDGIKKPIHLDVTGVDILELRTYGDDNGQVAGSFGAWGDPRVR